MVTLNARRSRTLYTGSEQSDSQSFGLQVRVSRQTERTGVNLNRPNIDKWHGVTLSPENVTKAGGIRAPVWSHLISCARYCVLSYLVSLFRKLKTQVQKQRVRTGTC